MSRSDVAQERDSKPRFLDCLRGEAVKTLSSRSTFVTLSMSVGVSVFVAALISFFNDGDVNPLSISLIGPFLGAWILVVLAAGTVAVEYSTGMIQQSLAVTPRRSRFAAAKLLLVVCMCLAAGLVLAFLSFAVSQAILSGTGRPSVGLGDSDVLRAVAVTGIFSVVYPLIAACLAVVIRRATGAILLTVLIAFFPMVMAELGSPWWSEIAVRFAPGGPMESLTGQAMPGTVGYMGAGSAILVTLAWLAAFLGAAFVSQARRDA